VSWLAFQNEIAARIQGRLDFWAPVRVEDAGDESPSIALDGARFSAESRFRQSILDVCMDTIGEVRIDIRTWVRRSAPRSESPV
jgi:hypothetical protein